MENDTETIKLIYQQCLSANTHRFREWSIEMLREIFNADAILWGRGFIGNNQLHSMNISGLGYDFFTSFARTDNDNLVFKKIMSTPGKAYSLIDLKDAKDPENTRIHKRLFKSFNVSRQLGIALLNDGAGIFNFMDLYRLKGSPVYSSVEKRRIEALFPHIVNATSLAFFLDKASPSAPFWHKSSGLCDEHGRIFECQASFLGLLTHRYPGWRGATLPFTLPQGSINQVETIGSLSVYLEPCGDLLLVRAWESDPLDRLTRRERQVATEIGHGSTLKAAGAALGLSQSTIANHLYSIYRKLDIKNRAQLTRYFVQRNPNGK